ncbi:MAG: hypothetical protein J2P23_10265, partial [Microlunatus sp.]|nr:hypothetical protein [Microlunatus sp.]
MVVLLDGRVCRKAASLFDAQLKTRRVVAEANRRRRPMGKVLSHMTMSLDGFIADPDNQVGELFDWYSAGEVTVDSSNPDISVNLDEADALPWDEGVQSTGALVAGRRLFDIAGGWNDQHPVGAPVVVVTH